MKSAFTRVAAERDLKDSAGTLVTVEGVDIALFRRDGTVYAVGNVCAHQHFSMLHRGEVRELTVTCPMHGWTYDLRSGQAINGSGKIRSYRVMVKNGDVYIWIGPEGEPA